MKTKIIIHGIVISLFFVVPAYALTGMAVIKGTTETSPVTGKVMITEKDDGIEIDATVDHVPNPGLHGFHIHEVGDCADEGKAAGGHFNPAKVEHGLLPKSGHEHAHAGDMGNIEIGQDGSGSLKIFLPGVYLKSKEPSVTGLSIILHEKADDFGQPTGNAGGRIGCGIIETMETLPDQATAKIDPMSVTK